MGVRGLTTFIHQRTEKFLEDYQLPHNSFLIIDGDSAAMNIYRQMDKKNTCFGGDYDKFADAIKIFFKKLSDCRVIPYVLFDGAIDPKKTEKCYNRLMDRVQASVEINTTNENEIQIFPLFVTEVFKSIVMENNIAMVVCDFECDKEVANIANKLNCPVLALDSDYFIFNVKYIPFIINNVHNLYDFIDVETNEKYLRCKIFNREKFFSVTRLTLEKLPILPVILGNDYITRILNVPQFWSFLNLCRCHNFTEAIIQWLAVTSSSVAIAKVVDFSIELKNKIFYSTFSKTVDYYTCKESHYLKYFQPNLSCEKNGVEVSCESSLYLKNISEIFVAKYRQGFYNPKFLHILLFHEYHSRPLVEVFWKDHSYKHCFHIISAIHTILTGNSSKELLFYGRVGIAVSKQSVPKYNKILPNFEQLVGLNIENKLNYFLEIVDIDQGFLQDCLALFPKSWHVMLITLKYLSKTSNIEWSFIYSLIMCKIILSYIDMKVGSVRCQTDFDSCAFKFKNEPENKGQITKISNVSQSIEAIDTKDCVKALEKMFPFFKMSTKMKYCSKLFDRNLVHEMSKFQSCLLHIDCLNDLFGIIFEKCYIWKCYNGTFIYNLFSLLKVNENLIYGLLETSPTILRSFKFIVNLLQTHIKLLNNSVFDFKDFLNI